MFWLIYPATLQFYRLVDWNFESYAVGHRLSLAHFLFVALHRSWVAQARRGFTSSHSAVDFLELSGALAATRVSAFILAALTTPFDRESVHGSSPVLLPDHSLVVSLWDFHIAPGALFSARTGP